MMEVMAFRNEKTISERIAIAGRLYGRWGDELKRDPGISSRIEELSARVKASSELSISSGVSRECGICEEEDGGSCCGAGIEDRYSPELLLLNLLLGATLPESGSSAQSCHFLGKSGCLLQAREILCINYLCRKLQKTIPREMLLQLQEANGAEMDLIFALHERIKGFIREKSA